jgi:hypothetical protein
MILRAAEKVGNQEMSECASNLRALWTIQGCGEH